MVHLQLNWCRYDQFSSNPRHSTLFQEVIVTLTGCVPVNALHLWKRQQERQRHWLLRKSRKVKDKYILALTVCEAVFCPPSLVCLHKDWLYRKQHFYVSSNMANCQQIVLNTAKKCRPLLKDLEMQYIFQYLIFLNPFPNPLISTVGVL